MPYAIVKKNGYSDNRIWKRKEDAKRHIRAIIRNNSLKQRQMTGFVGMKLKKIKTKNLYNQEKERLKGADKFIFQ